MNSPKQQHSLSTNCHAAPESTPQKKVFKLSQPVYEAVILHPSLGCPLIVENPASISLYIVANWNFAKVFAEGSGAGDEKGATGGNNIKLVILQSLKLLPWQEANRVLKNPGEVPKNLYPTRDEAFLNITCTCLGELNAELQNRGGQHFANIRAATVAQLEAAQLKYLYQVDLKNLTGIEPGKMYDCFWPSKNVDPLSVDVNNNFLDTQDRLTREYVFQNFYKYKNDGNGAPQEAPKYAFKIGEKGIIFEEDTNIPIMNRHPIYVPSAGKNSLNVGHLSDVHVSSKQHTYKGRKATVIPNVDESVSPAIGDKANNNGDNFFDLLQQFGNDSDVDLVVITGDLYDHIHNFDPRSRSTETTGQLWEAMFLDSIKAVQERADEFPCGIDGLAVYSLLINYYNTHEKPVFITSGNHEAYEYPYGISPRIPGVGKVNDGIPLDHNLTIYEAILLYGPGYDKLIPFPKKSDGLSSLRLNFKSRNFDWFFAVFTPLTDYWQIFGDQCIIGLEWGDGEDYIISNKIRRGGDLPRATQSLSTAQRDLVETALEQNKETVLCSHFTLINYSLDKPLKEKGKVGVDKFILSPYDHGSGLKDRSSMYGSLVNHPQLKLSLSGHSHRVGLYDCEQVKEKFYPSGNSALAMDYAPMTYPTQAIEYVSHVTTRGIHPEDPNAKQIGGAQKTKLLVSASTGPIPKQNLQGEMSGQGMEFPSGSKITGDGAITLLKSGTEQAKPRFAVACDYIDIMENGFWEHFKAVGSGGEFELKICWEKIYPNFPEEKKRAFISDISIHFIRGRTSKTSVAREIKLSADKKSLLVKFEETMTDKMASKKNAQARFLSLKFNGEAVRYLPGFKDYDYDSSWNIQVGLYDHKGRDLHDNPEDHLLPGFKNDLVAKYMVSKMYAASQDPSKWQIMRHKKFGEVPSFKWRKRHSRREFDCLLPLKH